MEVESRLFLTCWLGALAVAGAGNIHFLRADARRRGEKFVSAGMRAALCALWPSYLVAAVFTILFWRQAEALPIAWMLLYGLSLLATQHFAPRSIVLLGWAFLSAGLLVLIGVVSMPAGSDMRSWGNLPMGVTFGGFHLIYAAFAWPRGSRVADSQGEQHEAADAGHAP